MFGVSDTDLEAEEMHIALLRQKSTSERLALAVALSSKTFGLSRRAIRRSMPDASELDLKVRFVELHYGSELAQGYRACLEEQAR